MNTARIFVAAFLFTALTGATSFAQNIYEEYHINKVVECHGDPDHCYKAGQGLNYQISFMPATDGFTPYPNRFKLRIAFKEYKGQLPNYFSFVVTAGEVPALTDTGTYAEIVVDSSRAEPVLSAYAYNGGTEPSWVSAAPGQPADPIISTLSSPSWNASVVVTDTTVGGQAHRTFAIEFDSTPILNHVPAYPASSSWKGNSFGPSHFAMWLFPAVVLKTEYNPEGFQTSWQITHLGCVEQSKTLIDDTCLYDCEGNLLKPESTPISCETPTPTATATTTPTYPPTATSTPSATPTTAVTPSPSPTAMATPSVTTTPPSATPIPTPTPSPTPEDPLTPLGCVDEDNTEILAIIDASAGEIGKIAKKAARRVKKESTQRVAKRVARLSKEVESLGIEAWTQAWTIPAVTTNCISFSSTRCTTVDIQPLIAGYSDKVNTMSEKTTQILRRLKRINRRSFVRLRKALNETTATAVNSASQLPLVSLSCS